MKVSRVSHARNTAPDREIRTYYHTLAAAWGLQHWWPAHTPFEVIVGAFLTQNTSWTNVERALVNLRTENLLSLEGIRSVSVPELERLIRSSGYFRQKAALLKSFVEFLDRQYSGSLTELVALPTEQLRGELLALNGIGPETADSILLYAGNHPVFVVDAYTRRILERHSILPEKSSYEEIRQLFERSLAPLADACPTPMKSVVMLEGVYRGSPHSPSAMSTATRSPLAQIYNEMHALIVGVGKRYCKKVAAECDGCPLNKFLPLQRHGHSRSSRPR